MFNSFLKFKDVSYCYGNNEYVLSDINLEIKKGEKVGIIGKTGGGKSTLLDLFMGLLNSSKGEALFKVLSQSKTKVKWDKWGIL